LFFVYTSSFSAEPFLGCFFDSEFGLSLGGVLKCFKAAQIGRFWVNLGLQMRRFQQMPKIQFK
jgi:hypothetical protein